MTVSVTMAFRFRMAVSPVEKPRQQWRHGEAREVIGDLNFLELENDQCGAEDQEAVGR